MFLFPGQNAVSIEAAVATHPDATFVDVGPGNILHNRLGHTWRTVRCAGGDGPGHIDLRYDFSSALESLRARA